MNPTLSGKQVAAIIGVIALVMLFVVAAQVSKDNDRHLDNIERCIDSDYQAAGC